MLITDVYHHKPKVIVPTDTIRDALQKMLEEDVNGFVVVDRQKVVGILSLQDIAAATVPEEFQHNIGIARAMYVQGFFHETCQAIQDKPVSEIMRKKFVAVDLETNILSVMADFLENDLYIVPVIERKKLIGIITRTEVKKALAKGMNLL